MRASLLLLVVFTFLMAGFIFAADKANFSGEWSLNEDKSEMGDGGRGFGRAATKLVVTQEADKITIARTSQGRDGEERVREETLTLDGKENEIEGFRGSTRKVTATWSDDGKTLSMSSHMEFERDGQSFEMTSTEVWSLKEAKVLSIESTRSTPNGERKSTLVYEKAS